MRFCWLKGVTFPFCFLSDSRELRAYRTLQKAGFSLKNRFGDFLNTRSPETNFVEFTKKTAMIILLARFFWIKPAQAFISQSFCLLAYKSFI